MAFSANSTMTPVPVNIVHGTHGQLVLFLFLNMWPSHLGLPLLLGVIIFSKKIQRHPTFLNLCVAFIITGISSSLLVYAGRTTGPEPSSMLCLLQASLLYGVPPLASMSAFVLVLQMFLVIRAAYHGKEYLDRDHVVRVWTMLIAPYFFFFVTLLATAIIGAANPTKVSRSRRFFYCSVESLSLTNTLTIFAAIVLFSTLVIEALTVGIFYKRWSGLRQRGSELSWPIELSLPIRIMGFGLYIIIAMSLSLLSVTSPSSPVPDLMIASAATFVLLIFGTQLDILRAMRFWRKAPSRRVLNLSGDDSSIFKVKKELV